MVMTPAPDLSSGMYGSVDMNALVQQMYTQAGGAGGGTPTQTRSGRISRPPPSPSKQVKESDSPAVVGSSHSVTVGVDVGGPSGRDDTPPSDVRGAVPRRGRGRPKLPEDVKLSRLRERNKNAAFLSRQRRKEQEDQNRDLLEKKTRECNELSDRCHELEAQVRELQATLQAHGLPLPSVPGPVRRGRSYWGQSPPPPPPAPYPLLPPPQQAQQQFMPYGGGLEALAAAALPNLAPTTGMTPSHGHGHGISPMSTTALGDLNTPLHTTPAPVAPISMDPDIMAALEALNLPAYNYNYGNYSWRPDDDAISLSALFTLDDLGEDANDGDFVPPTSPKGESSDSESEGEGEDEPTPRAPNGGEERPSKRRRTEERPTHTPKTPETADDDNEVQEADDEPEDLCMPIEDVPVPEDQLYADAMTALGVSTPAELAVVVAKIVETASRGGVTPEQVEGLRRLMRLAEARGAALTANGANGGSSRRAGARSGEGGASGSGARNQEEGSRTAEKEHERSGGGSRESTMREHRKGERERERGERSSGKRRALE